jgi:ribosomal protein S2
MKFYEWKLRKKNHETHFFFVATRFCGTNLSNVKQIFKRIIDKPLNKEFILVEYSI